MGNTPSNQASPARSNEQANGNSRNPNLRLPMPQRPAHISPNSSNPTSPSGRSGSPRRRKSLELPDLNKLSFTPAAPVATLATHTSHHLATPSKKPTSPSSVPTGSKWRQALGGRTASPLANNALGAMSKIDGPASVPVRTAPIDVSPTRGDSYFPSSPTKRKILPISIPGRGASPARKEEGTEPPPPTVAPTPPSRVSREDLSDGLVNVPLAWTGGGKSVFVTGNFADNWKGRIKLDRSSHDFNTVVRLAPGQYRLKFIVDDSWRCSREIATATDDDGTLVNWIEVEKQKSEEENKTDWSAEVRPVIEADDSQWTSTIPAPLVLYQYIEELPMTCAQKELEEHVARFPHMTSVPQPPTLPRILDKVILNVEPKRTWDEPSSNQGVDDNSILPVPNHVVLNHLTASAIKNGTLGVGTTTRYRKKYITTMYFKPTLGDLMDGPGPSVAAPENETKQ